MVARLEAGGFFGEMGLLNDKARRYASARTAAPAVLLRVEKPDLIQLLPPIRGWSSSSAPRSIRRHGMNVSALLGLAGQRDVRIRLGRRRRAQLADGTRLAVTLENLSLGGVGLSGVPFDWQTGSPVRFRLGLPGEPDILDVVGSVTWREGDTVGIAFGPEGRRQRPGGAAGAAAVSGFAAVERRTLITPALFSQPPPSRREKREKLV